MREIEAQRETRLSLVNALAYGSRECGQNSKRNRVNMKRNIQRRREEERERKRGRGGEGEEETEKDTEREAKRRNERTFAADFILFLDLAIPEVHLGILVMKPINSLFYLSQLEMCFSDL